MAGREEKSRKWVCYAMILSNVIAQDNIREATYRSRLLASCALATVRSNVCLLLPFSLEQFSFTRNNRDDPRVSISCTKTGTRFTSFR